MQQPQLIPGSSDQLHSDLKQGRSMTQNCYNFGEPNRQIPSYSGFVGISDKRIN